MVGTYYHRLIRANGHARVIMRQ